MDPMRSAYATYAGGAVRHAASLANDDGAASERPGRLYLILAVAFALLVTFGHHLVQQGDKSNERAPYALRLFSFGPRLFTGAYYSRNAQTLIEDSYRKFKQQAFRMVRGDVTMLFLPPSALNELAALPPEVASNLGALSFDLVGLFAALGMPSTKSNRLHHRVVQNKVTQNLGASRASIEDEIKRAVDEYFPKKKGEWARIQPYWVLSKVVARASSRVLVGRQWAKDPNWLDFQINFVENTLISSIQTRNFPTWTWPLLKHILPSTRALRSDVARAHSILDPVFAAQLKARDEGTFKPTGDEPNGVDWLTEIAEGFERDPWVLTNAEIILTLASVHTSSFNAINTLYDLMANPEHIDLLRAELASAVPTRSNPSTSTTTDADADGDTDDETLAPAAAAAASDLPQLDSVLRESQRFSPPSIIGLRRIMRTSITLNDGTLLPAGSYVCVGTQAIQQLATPDATTYDGLRSFRARAGRAGSSKGLFTSPEREALTWGLGRTACPGRWFAALVLKTLFTKLLGEFEFAFPEGRVGRPLNSLGHEFLLPERDAEILVRRRGVEGKGSAAA